MTHPIELRGQLAYHREQLTLDEADRITSEIGAARYRKRLETIARLERKLAVAETLPFGFDRAECVIEPFCACGRVISSCDRSRKGCGSAEGRVQS